MAFNFPPATFVGQTYGSYTWDGEKWLLSVVTSTGVVRYDSAQTLTANQQAQGRSNIGALKKNYIINGAMMVSQENGTANGGISGYYPADQFQLGATLTTGTYGVAQIASATPAGSPNRIRVTVTAANASVAATDRAWIEQRFEGLRTADLLWGGATAKTVTLQFGVRAPAGTYSVIFTNGATTRSYAAEYVIASGESMTVTMKSVTVPGDVTGTWPVDNSAAMFIRWGLIAGSSYVIAPNAWTATASIVGSTNQFNFFGTNGNMFELFDVGLYEGNVAPPFMVPDYASELALCGRYYQQAGVGLTGGAVGTTNVNLGITFVPKMRAAPTLLGPQAMLTVDNINANATASNTAAGTSILAGATATGGELTIGGFTGLTWGGAIVVRSMTVPFSFSARL